jgi:hypothetical protein
MEKMKYVLIWIVIIVSISIVASPPFYSIFSITSISDRSLYAEIYQYFYFDIITGIGIGYIIGFFHIFFKDANSKYRKCIFLGFMLGLIPCTVLIQMEVIVHFMEIPMGSKTTFTKIYAEGLLYGLAKTFYFSLAPSLIFFNLLGLFLQYRKRTDVPQ